ncbi:MAG: ABC-2 transporter permease [Gammaproteobacteria bacterium]|nr:ABC-2 transporter permease [Gammaproteobacteria bacterium]
MIGHQFALIKRELWEHRSIYVTPAAIAVIVTLGVLAMLVLASGFAKGLDLAIFGAQNIAGDLERRAVLAGFFVGTSWVFLVALMFLTVFYSLDSLYAERKDKSILFWRSMPVTDAETVISKLITAAIVIPAITAVGIWLTHLVNLIVTSIWVSGKGGDAGLLIWGSISILDNWLAALIVVIASGLWMSPFIAWFLFVSTWAKRMPILMAFMPPIVLGLLEWIVFRTQYFLTTVGERGDMTPLFHSMSLERFFEEEQWRDGVGNISLLEHMDLVGFVTDPGFWSGLLVCALLTTAAIYVRRYRDDS